MGYTVISSTPSPYARKILCETQEGCAEDHAADTRISQVRINLIEQNIPFKLQTEVPWNNDTQTPNYNPLEKLPILIISSESDPNAAPTQVVYESSVILDFLNHSPAPGPNPTSTTLLPSDPAERLAAKQYEALADGVADALILWFWEGRREKSQQSAEWADRQLRKVNGGLKALDEAVRKNAQDSGYLVGGKLSIADLSAGSLLGFMDCREEKDWMKKYPALEKYWKGLEQRESFKQTVPTMFELKDKVV